MNMKGKTFDHIITIILTLVCIGLAVAVFVRSSGENQQDGRMPGMDRQNEAASQSAVNVNAVTAEPSEFIKTRRLSGEISSLDKDIPVTSEIAGKVARIAVQRGDSVRKGDVLLYIDPSKPGMSYKESAVTAPADGIVYEVNVSDGMSVSTSTSLVLIRGDRTLKIDINIPEKDIGTVTLGAEATVRSIAYPDREWNAEITYLSDSLSTASRTLPAELSIIGDTEGLIEGMYVSAEVEVKKTEDVIIVPSSAVSSYAGNSVVYLVADGKAVRTVVETGDSDSESTVITSGISAGDIVITAGNVTDGTSVAIV